MRNRLIQVLTLVLLFTLGQFRAASQGKPEMAISSQQVYAAVPDADRQEFRTALEALIALEKSGDWGEVYERFFSNDRGMTKEQFIKQRGKLRITAFAPKQIYYVPPSESWVVSGCAEFSPPLPLMGKKRGGFVSSFTARHTANGWRFDAPPAITIYKETPTVRSCAVDQ